MSRIEDFFKLYSSPNTVEAYRYSLIKFFKIIYGENEHSLEERAEQYFQEKRNIEQDIQNFFVTIKDKPPKTIRLLIAAVKSFLIENDVELSQKFWRRLIGRVKGSKARTTDRVPPNIELRRIMMHIPIQGKALYLTLASSGMRIGEALQLKPQDIEFEQKPCKINVRGEYTKTGNSRITFISREAVEALQEWLKVRENYLLAAARKSHTYKKETVDPRIFPFEDNTAYAMWINAIKKSGSYKRDPSTQRATVHPHVLRKFFRSKMGMIIPRDIAEALMGHEEHLTEVYRKYGEEDLAKFYLQGEPALLIFTEAEEVGKLRIEVEERSKQLQNSTNTLLVKNLDLESRLSKVEQKLASLETKIDEIIQSIDSKE